MYVLLPAALVFAVGAVIVFVWAARSGQFDDVETPAVRILFDEPPAPGGTARRAAPSRPVVPGAGGGAQPALRTAQADKTRRDPR